MSDGGQVGWKDADEARERTRELVARAYANEEGPPTRTCPSCGREAATWLGRCPHCNKRYDRRLPWLTDPMRWALAILLLAALGGVIAYAAPRVSESNEERAARLAREQQARVDRETARLVREQRPIRGRLPAGEPTDAPASERRAARGAMVRALEDAILADSARRLASGELSGSSVKVVECGPLVRTPEGIADDEVLTRRRGRYDCVAATRDVRRFGRTVALFGHPYVATIDFRRGTYVFCKDNKLPGERGKSLAQVKLAPECLGAEGAAELSGGYITPAE